ncbi:MAG: DUF6785 family protein, partial [Armatimonadota bacterium]
MEAKHEQHSLGVTWRAILVGLLLIPLNTYWVTLIEVQWYSLDGTSLPLFITPIFILFVLCMLNLGARRFRPSLAFDRAELTIVYVMVVMSCVLAGHDMLQNMFGAISHPFYFASRENQYHKLFLDHMPSFVRSLLVPSGPALDAFYRGGSNPWTSGYWRIWILPLSLWAVFLVVLFSMMLATNVILRRAWTQNEKLVFPLVQLPVAMAAGAEGHGIFQTKALWWGFGVAMAISGFNGLNTLFPTIPAIQGIKQYQLGPLFETPPWNAIAGTRISMYPFAIGIAFFLPLDLSFSCWFFFVARVIFRITGRAAGWDTAAATGFPYFGEQAAGAWIALGLVTIWSTRHYLKNVWLQIVGKAKEQEPGEARDYKIAFAVIIAGLLFLCLWSALMNISWWVAIIFFGLYLLLSLTLTRVRAELGTPHEIYFVNPHDILAKVFGTNMIGMPTMTAICTMYWFNRGMRCHPMPNVMESFKMAEYAKVNYRKMAAVIFLAFTVGIVSTYFYNLQETYQLGARSGKTLGFKWWLGDESYRTRLTAWLQNPVHGIPEVIKSHGKDPALT